MPGSPKIDTNTKTMKYTLRDYQKRFARAVTDAFDGKVNGTRFQTVLGIAATGAGKTIISTALMWYWSRKLKMKSLFLADSDELCAQSVGKLYTAGDIIGDLEKAESRASLRSDCVVGSIQSMQIPARLERFPQDHFRYVIADEAHLSLTTGWQRVLNHFKAGGAQILGVTATPERGDKKSLMTFYDHVAAEIPLAELIRARHLSPFTVETVPLEIRITSDIKGDGELEDVAEELKAYYSAIITAWEHHAADRKKTLWFHPSVKAAKVFSEMLMERGHSSAYVHGKSPDRAEILKGFEVGRFSHLNNCQMLTKGYDCPDIDCIVILRPYKSRTAYTQAAGRGSRLYCPHGCAEWCDHPDRKRDCLLLDFLWEFATHDIMGPADLLTDAPEQRAALAKRLREGKPRDLLAEDEFVTGEREQELLEKLRQQKGKRGQKVDALAFAAMMHTPHLLDYEPVARWQSMPVSPAQAEVLERAGVDVRSIKDRGMASAIMEVVIARRERAQATLKQINQLVRMGIPHTPEISKDEATAIIAEKWKR